MRRWLICGRGGLTALPCSCRDLPPVEFFTNLKGSVMSKLSSPQRDAIPSRQFAFVAQRKEPLENASHVRNAVARFNQVQGVSDAERDAAWVRIQHAATLFGVTLHESGWRDLPARRGDSKVKGLHIRARAAPGHKARRWRFAMGLEDRKPQATRGQNQE